MSALTVLLTDEQLSQLADLIAARLPQPPAPAPAMDEPAYYTVQEAAQVLRVDATTIYAAVRDGQISRTPIGRGREYRISREALREYAQRQGRAA